MGKCLDRPSAFPPAFVGTSLYTLLNGTAGGPLPMGIHSPRSLHTRRSPGTRRAAKPFEALQGGGPALVLGSGDARLAPDPGRPPTVRRGFPRPPDSVAAQARAGSSSRAVQEVSMTVAVPGRSPCPRTPGVGGSSSMTTIRPTPHAGQTWAHRAWVTLAPGMGTGSGDRASGDTLSLSD